MDSSVIVAIITTIGSIVTTIYATHVKKQNKSEVKIKKLVNHHFFNRVDLLITEINNNFYFKNKGKELICKEIINKQITHIKEKLITLATNIDNLHIQDEEHLYNTCLLIMNDITIYSYNFYKEDNTYTEEERKILDLVMFKYEQWNSTFKNSIIENIRMCCFSSSYKDLQTKCSVILDIYLSIIIIKSNIAEKTICSLNGDLRGMTFKGVVI